MTTILVAFDTKGVSITPGYRFSNVLLKQHSRSLSCETRLVVNDIFLFFSFIGLTIL